MKEILAFLNELARNNDRVWFNAHKAEYQNLARLLEIFQSGKPFLDYVNRAVEYVKEENKSQKYNLL